MSGLQSSPADALLAAYRSATGPADEDALLRRIVGRIVQEDLAASGEHDAVVDETPVVEVKPRRRRKIVTGVFLAAGALAAALVLVLSLRGEALQGGEDARAWQATDGGAADAFRGKSTFGVPSEEDDAAVVQDEPSPNAIAPHRDRTVGPEPDGAATSGTAARPSDRGSTNGGASPEPTAASPKARDDEGFVVPGASDPRAPSPGDNVGWVGGGMPGGGGMPDDDKPKGADKSDGKPGKKGPKAIPKPTSKPTSKPGSDPGSSPPPAPPTDGPEPGDGTPDDPPPPDDGLEQTCEDVHQMCVDGGIPVGQCDVELAMCTGQPVLAEQCYANYDACMQGWDAFTCYANLQTCASMSTGDPLHCERYVDPCVIACGDPALCEWEAAWYCTGTDPCACYWDGSDPATCDPAIETWCNPPMDQDPYAPCWEQYGVCAKGDPNLGMGGPCQDELDACIASIDQGAQPGEPDACVIAYEVCLQDNWDAPEICDGDLQDCYAEQQG